MPRYAAEEWSTPFSIGPVQDGGAASDSVRVPIGDWFEWIVNIPYVGLGLMAVLLVLLFLASTHGKGGGRYIDWSEEWPKWTIGKVVVIGFVLVFLLFGICAGLGSDPEPPPA